MARQTPFCGGARRAAHLAAAGILALTSVAVVAAPAAAGRQAFDLAAPAKLKDLTSGNYGKRHAAMKFFTHAGGVAVPYLKKQVALAGSPQLKAMLAGALQAIHMRAVMRPTLITLQLHQATPGQVLAALARKTGADFAFLTPRLPPAKPKININATRQKFWTIMRELQRKTGIKPSTWGFTSPSGELILEAGKPGALPPAYLHGPFMIQALKKSQALRQKIETYVAPTGVKGAPPAKTFTLHMMLVSEPKITLLDVGQIVIDKAITNTGKSLLEQKPLAPVWRQTTGHVASSTAKLFAVPQSGKFIAKLRGHWNQFVATRISHWTINNLATAKAKTKTKVMTHTTRDGTKITFGGLKKVGSEYSATITLSNPSGSAVISRKVPGILPETLNDVQGEFVSGNAQCIAGNLKLVDAHGAPFTFSGETNSAVHRTGYTFTLIWAPIARFGGTAPVGPPKKMTISIPTEFENIRIPFKFNHLPLP